MSSDKRVSAEKLFAVEWEEAHIYKYVAAVYAKSRSDANKKAHSVSRDGPREELGESVYCEFDRVKSKGRKRVIEEQ